MIQEIFRIIILDSNDNSEVNDNLNLFKELILTINFIEKNIEFMIHILDITTKYLLVKIQNLGVITALIGKYKYRIYCNRNK